jgi:hypothetical protein
VVARIFLSYAREDEAQVRGVYRRLLDAGFDVWMDKIDLLPGQRWQQEIPHAIRSAAFILIFFSRNSVAKRGYIQREFRLALDTLEEMPPDAIHTIPIRLDDCEIPEQFHHLQWSDLSEAGEFDRIVQALRWGMDQRQTVAPEPALEPPPNPRSDKDHTFSESEGRSIAETPTHPSQESECTTNSQSEKSLEPKSHRVSVITIVSLVIAVVSALAAVTVVPDVREWLGLDKPFVQRSTIDDHDISAKVKTALHADDEVSSFQVNVETFKGTVQLSGFVDTMEQAERAAEIARSVNGVKDVVNNIVVK